MKGKSPGANWRIQRHFRNIEIPHTAYKESPREYTYLPAYINFICDIFTANHTDLTKRDVIVMMFLYKTRYFTLDDLLNFPHEPGKWGRLTAKKTITHLLRNGWIRVHKNNGRSNPRIYAFADKTNIEFTRLYRVLYMMDPIGTSKFPVDKRFYDNPSYALAILDINKTIKKIKKDVKAIEIDKTGSNG